jgi:hypothetical protein
MPNLFSTDTNPTEHLQQIVQIPQSPETTTHTIVSRYQPSPLCKYTPTQPHVQSAALFTFYRSVHQHLSRRIINTNEYIGVYNPRHSFPISAGLTSNICSRSKIVERKS